MKRSNKAAMALLAAGMLSSGVAQAALNDRGGGLLYDDVLKVTWLQDANYAKTQFASTGGVQGDADGFMNWSAANTWAANLSFHDSVRNVNLTGWRLPTVSPVGANWNYNFSYDGSTDIGFNITSQHSELSYMYYVNLGLKGSHSPTGVYQPDFGIFGNGTIGVQNDVSPVKNLQSNHYWYGTAGAPDISAYNAWAFGASDGYQAYYFYNQNAEFSAWAVRPGDVAAVPEPEAYALLMAGLGLLGTIARQRKNKQG